MEFVKPTFDPAGFRLGGVMDYRGEMMVEGVGGFEIPGEGLGFESYGLVGDKGLRVPLSCLMGEKNWVILYLWEQDSVL